MEVQSPPRSVQINFKNKIITLHNVTIVKNPKIITIDAKHYSNLLKGSPNGKLLGGTTTPIKIQMPSLVPMKTIPTQNIAFKINQQQSPVIKEIPKVVTTTPPPKNGLFQFKSASIVPCSALGNPVKLQTLPSNQQPSVIISPPKATIASTPLNQSLPQTKIQLKPKFVVSNSPTKTPTATPVKVIISPPHKNKTSPCIITPPDAKRPCKKLEFRCIFTGCDEIFDESNVLVDHIKIKHAESVRMPSPEENKVESETHNNVQQVFASKSSTTQVNESEDSDNEDDESEVNDLIMDLEDTTTQDTTEPESPEFEKHVPESPVFEKHVPLIKEEEIKSEDEDCGLDYDDFEYYSSIMEPICELSCEDDSNDGVQDENEAMRLYREAMEVNYQQNGIKKRGRRKQNKPKPLVENTTSLNGILAGLLENASIKVPPGPGRGRRKEMNEQELEVERSNGVCLFSCNKCDLTFKFAGDLAKHVRSHTISSPYQCSICSRKFTHIGSLNTHLRIHSGERPYKCNQCEKSFTQSNSLMVHVKSHLSNKPFQCDLCNKGFLNPSSLQLHQKTHTGPLLTVFCPIEECKKEFRDSNLLEEHMMTHRQSMLYQCSLCSEKFEQSCVLVQHVKTHIGDKPFQCNLCNKSFTQPGSLNTHLRIHTGEKPFKCQQCLKTFTQASSLSVHMKVHGEKEFKCTIEGCSKSFGQEAYLKKHMLKHIETSLNDENMIRQ